METKTQEGAAAVAGMGVRTARRWQDGPLPSQRKKPRTWRTRKDPFAAVWAAELVPLLERDGQGVLEAQTLLEELERLHPGKYGPGQVRTLQRRMCDWRALYGPEKEVFFEQCHEPGRETAFDFTHCTELGVTIGGELFRHLVFQMRLSYSGWRWGQVARGETFEALVDGLQGGFWALGGVTPVVRHDNLSAATHELKRSGGRALNTRFREVLDYLGVERSSRITPGESHENGGAEKGNDLTKRALAQALVLRGSKEFASRPEYQAFVQQVIERSCNRGSAARLAEERARLRPLPPARLPVYTTVHPEVRKWSTVTVAKRVYSVPSRLRGHEVEVRLHPEEVELRYGGKTVETMPRLFGSDTHRIDYRHIIWSLVRKPGAFARYRYREDLFPTLTFRRAYDALRKSHGERADVEYVRVLHLAASTMEATVEQALVRLLERGERFDYAAVKAEASPQASAVPEVTIGEPDLRVYDGLVEMAS